MNDLRYKLRNFSNLLNSLIDDIMAFIMPPVCLAIVLYGIAIMILSLFNDVKTVDVCAKVDGQTICETKNKL